ncbi:hypothetical protein PG993_010650 [Apiospora rasikravindrae]|uniref:Uncharacterized protein n=1 Tax=Apiospora rasikravindrae TaxID=990691 RepID=A0ABR1SMX7_9PEZI
MVNRTNSRAINTSLKAADTAMTSPGPTNHHPIMLKECHIRHMNHSSSNIDPPSPRDMPYQAYDSRPPPPPRDMPYQAYDSRPPPPTQPAPEQSAPLSIEQMEQLKTYIFGQGQSSGFNPKLTDTGSQKTSKPAGPPAKKDKYDFAKLPDECWTWPPDLGARRKIKCGNCNRFHPPEICRGPLDSRGRVQLCTYCGMRTHTVDKCRWLLHDQNRPQWLKYLIWTCRQGLAPLRTTEDYSQQPADNSIVRPVLNPALAKMWEREVMSLDRAAKRHQYWKRFQWTDASSTVLPEVSIDSYPDYDSTWVLFENSERAPPDTKDSASKAWEYLRHAVQESSLALSKRKRDRPEVEDLDKDMPDADGGVQKKPRHNILQELMQDIESQQQNSSTQSHPATQPGTKQNFGIEGFKKPIEPRNPKSNPFEDLKATLGLQNPKPNEPPNPKPNPFVGLKKSLEPPTAKPNSFVELKKSLGRSNPTGMNNLLEPIVSEVNAASKSAEEKRTHPPTDTGSFQYCDNCCEHHPPSQMGCEQSQCGVCGGDHAAWACSKEDSARCQCQYYPRHDTHNCHVRCRKCFVEDGSVHDVHACIQPNASCCALCGGTHAVNACKKQRCMGLGSGESGCSHVEHHYYQDCPEMACPATDCTYTECQVHCNVCGFEMFKDPTHKATCRWERRNVFVAEDQPLLPVVLCKYRYTTNYGFNERLHVPAVAVPIHKQQYDSRNVKLPSGLYMMNRGRWTRGGSRFTRGGGRQNRQRNNHRNDNSGVQDSTTYEDTRASEVAVAMPQVASASSQQPQTQPGQYNDFNYHHPYGHESYGQPYGRNSYGQPLRGYMPLDPPPYQPPQAMPYQAYEAPPPRQVPVQYQSYEPPRAMPYQAYEAPPPPQMPLQYHAYEQRPPLPHMRVQYQAYGQPPPPHPPPQPAARVTNPYTQRDPGFAEWERSHTSSFGQGQPNGIEPELSNTVEARKWSKKRRRQRRRFRGPRHHPATMSNSAPQLELNDVETEDKIKEEDDPSPTGAITGWKSWAEPNIKSEPKTP